MERSESLSLAELRERLDDYIDVLRVLDGVRGDPLVEQKFALLKSLVQEVRNSMAALDSTIDKGKQLCEKMRAQTLHFELLQAKMRDQMSNCDTRISTPLQDGGAHGWISPTSVSTVVEHVTPSSGHVRNHRLTVPNFRSRGLSPVNQPVSQFPLPPGSGISSYVSMVESSVTPKPRRDMDIAISYVSRAEFEAIPQYMRGRVRFDEIVAFTGIFNDVLNKKYSLIKKPKKLVKTKNEMDLLLEWKEQSHPDLRDQYFINEKDFTSLNSHKLSQKDRNILTMLRHVQRLKEIRVNRVCYYIACF